MATGKPLKWLNALQPYYNSLAKSLYWYTFIIDFLTFWLIIGSFILFSRYLEKISQNLMQGKGIEELKQYLLTGPAQDVQALTSNLKYFFLVFLFGFFLWLIISFFIASLSRAMIWHKIKNVPLTLKNYWRWNLLQFTVIIPVLFFAAVILGLKVLIISFMQRHSSIDALNITPILNNLGNFLAFIIIMLFLFAAKSHFVKGKLFSSLAAAFQSLVQKKTYIIFGFGMIIATFLTLILYGLQNVLHFNNLLINSILSFLYLAWLRMEFVRREKT